MSSPPSLSVSTSVRRSGRRQLGILLAGYACVLLAAALAIPLRIPEVLQAASIRNFSHLGFFHWIAQEPNSAPLNPMAQVPFLLAAGHSRLGVRFVSIVFAVGACYLFLRLAQRIPLERPYLALLLFMVLPVHFELSFEARPFEQALFLVVLATGRFYRLVFRPEVKNALIYAGCLTLCLYTDRDSYLPAVGYLLFLLRFIDREQERRAIWHALAASITPVLLFLPYAVWNHTQANPDWLAESPSLASSAIYVRALRSLAPPHWASYALCVLSFSGVIVGVWASFRVTVGPIGKRIRLFVLAGGIASTLIMALGFDLSSAKRFTTSHVLWTVSSLVILIVAGIEWMSKRSGWRTFARVAAIVVIAICVAADVEFLFFSPSLTAREDLQAIAADVPSQLSEDSCVVFVSERLSRTLFLVFEPQLQPHECLNFFHSRIILASHPYVTSDQQQDAESFFRGLNLGETKRIKGGGGQIVVMQQIAP